MKAKAKGKMLNAKVLLLISAFSVQPLAFVSCTVTPRTVTDPGASFDGNARTSGLIGYAADGSGILTPRARDRYNALIAEYGNRFAPPLTPDAGVSQTATNTYLLDAEHLVDFAVMNGWRKSGQKPR